MTLTVPLSLTIGSDTLSMPRTVGPDGRASTFEWSRADGTRQYVVNLKHTVPSNPTGEHSHLIRMDARNFDSARQYVSTESIWMVAKTTGAAQDASSLEEIYQGVRAALQLDSLQLFRALMANEV